MQQLLMNKLHEYLSGNNPDLLVTLQQENRVTAYLEDKIETVVPLLEQLRADGKPGYIIEEACMALLTEDLRPSKFNYVSRVLEEEFEADYYRFKELGILTYEVINMINECDEVFETFGFTEENEDDRGLYYAVTGTISGYLATLK